VSVGVGELLGGNGRNDHRVDADDGGGRGHLLALAGQHRGVGGADGQPVLVEQGPEAFRIACRVVRLDHPVADVGEPPQRPRAVGRQLVTHRVQLHSDWLHGPRRYELFFKLSIKRIELKKVVTPASGLPSGSDRLHP
jgi:hypothetical protein